jgi:hypothetical protein
MAGPGSRRARQANATAAAQSYAPKPNGSAFTYGMMAASLLLVVAFLAGAFFRVDVTSNGWALAGLAVVAFAAGGALRIWRRSEHSRAVAREFAIRGSRAAVPDPSPAGADGTGPAIGRGIEPEQVPETVTFKLPFDLPGLGRLHPPGTFRVRERREALDVSWDAFVVTKTIMLTDRGTVEALDVRADDLAAALHHDQTAFARTK